MMLILLKKMQRNLAKNTIDSIVHKVFFICFVSISLGCDSTYTIQIKNSQTETIQLKISPPVENFFLGEIKDTILSFRIAHNEDTSTYEISKGQNIVIYGSVGSFTQPEGIPFNYMEIISAYDTIVLDSKQKIFSQFSKVYNGVYEFDPSLLDGLKTD